MSIVWIKTRRLEIHINCGIFSEEVLLVVTVQKDHPLENESEYGNSSWHCIEIDTEASRIVQLNCISHELKKLTGIYCIFFNSDHIS